MPTNALLVDWSRPHNCLPPFEPIRTEEFVPALNRAMALHRDELAQIGAHPGEHDNRPVAREMIGLRREQAALLGDPAYPH